MNSVSAHARNAGALHSPEHALSTIFQSCCFALSTCSRSSAAASLSQQNEVQQGVVRGVCQLMELYPRFEPAQSDATEKQARELTLPRAPRVPGRAWTSCSFCFWGREGGVSRKQAEEMTRDDDAGRGG